MKLLFVALALVAQLGCASTASPNFSKCSDQFANGTPPVIQVKPAMKVRSMCFTGFAVMHSGQSRTPIFVAERLNRKHLIAAQKIERNGRFFSDARLPRAERAHLDDYKGSAFDRGHMAPAANMASDESMAQSFSLANIIPQDPQNNRKAWAKIENDTRKYVMRAAGDVFVITGTAFGPKPVTIGSNRVWVPQHIFKLVYDPSTNRSWAHWMENTAKARAGKPISYAELVARTGTEFLPSVALALN